MIFLSTGCIHEVFGDSTFVVNLFSVSVNESGKKMLVLDLRHVNQFVKKQKVKFERVNEALQYAKKNVYMIKYD